MLDPKKYITDEEMKIIEDDIASQVSFLKSDLEDKTKFIKKDRKISIMREGDVDADESV